MPLDSALADSVATLFECFPPVILGVTLLFRGLELAANVKGASTSKEEGYIALPTTGLARWNMGVGDFGALLLAIAYERKWVWLWRLGHWEGKGAFTRV